MMRPLQQFILKTRQALESSKKLLGFYGPKKPVSSTEKKPRLVYSKGHVITDDRNPLDILSPSQLADQERVLNIALYTTSALLLAILASTTLYWELRTSGIEAHVGSWLSPHLTHTVSQGANEHFRAPQKSPFNTMLGYSQIPQWTEVLEGKGFQIQSQAGLDTVHRGLVDLGLHPLYIEKNIHGLRLVQGQRGVIHQDLYPRLRYPEFRQIPPLVRDTLLYIEDRQILDEKKSATMNPAISWERLVRAVVDFILDKTVSDRNVPGGSTLATQIEKFRHSPDGRTQTPGDKIKQILSATLRSYLLGKDTTIARQQIILNYINEVPLGAAYGFGEVRGLGEALQVWFGSDFKTMNELLMLDGKKLSFEEKKAQAKAYKQVLSLFLSQRRPTYYLLHDPKDLDILTSSYLRLLKGQGVIPSYLADLAQDQPLDIIPFTRSRLTTRDVKGSNNTPINKAAYATRVELKSLLGVKSLYEIDRLDLEVHSTFIPQMQERVARRLRDFRTAEGAKSAGLIGERMLLPGQAQTVHYSFTLVESQGTHNAVRVQTDTLEGPLDLNRGGKLELGSTAKLRTLVTYLEMIAEIYEQESKSAELLTTAQQGLTVDPLTEFVTSYLKAKRNELPTSNGSLDDLLNQALNRKYSASPYQSFWTGGGRLSFNNFNSDDDSLDLSVLEGFQRSNNLVFVRMMKDIVEHVIHYKMPDKKAMLADPQHPKRHEYLNAFIEMESRQYIRRFYRELRNKSPEERFETLVKSKHLTSSRLAAIIQTLKPNYDYLAFRLTMKQYLSNLDDKHIQSLYYSTHPFHMNLTDRAYLARTHPLMLWTAHYLDVFPKATWSDILWDSRHARKESYDWLKNKASPSRQERDIRTMLEREVFQKHLLSYWKRQGFPFNSMIPTLATALGSSGDRPAALADLMGAIHNQGMLFPTLRIEGLSFGRSTPFETNLAPVGQSVRRAMRSEVALAAQKAVRAVVTHGTARRLEASLVKADGQVIPIAAKTGTGDNRLDIYNNQGHLIRSEAKNRTATLIFGIGNRFFGTITAYVDHKSSKVDEYQFTSSLVVQGLKALVPEISEEILAVEDPEGKLFRSKVTH